MAENDRLRNDQGRGRYRSREDHYGRAEGRYEDFGGRPDQGRFTGEGGSRGGVEGRFAERRHAEQGRYEDFGGRPDQGRFTGEGGGPRGGTEGYGYGGGYRRGGDYSRDDRGQYYEDRGYGSGGGPGFGGDYYSGFYGADQAYGRGRSEDRGYAGSSGYPRSERGYLDTPHADAWRRGAESVGNEVRGFWDRAADEVSSWFRGDRRSAYEGRGEHRGRGPKGYTRPDERILEEVNDRLTDDSYLDASDIEVSVANREVTLSGTVDSRDAKRRAEDVAESVPGVTHVQNNLRMADRSYGTTSRSGAAQVTEPPLGESITAMNSSDANRIARETFGPMEDTTVSKRR